MRPPKTGDGCNLGIRLGNSPPRQLSLSGDLCKRHCSPSIKGKYSTRKVFPKDRCDGLFEFRSAISFRQDTHPVKHLCLRDARRVEII
ncbi:hypothetical protein HJG40_14835 [Acidithiobacillus sp. ATCC 19703]|uniref:Uncharacterized protein n=1 Tax=Acidithiobacillus concretivorus TaxID=3063952 RepID=A0ABS5ZTN2_9PROT|nr:hypothetical protein [Acidithiobacillus concretivorus]MBU2740026.1 hypothetical protein [Acidithiobacillus concretivorus]